jgi:predicted nucleic acid-binding protein
MILIDTSVWADHFRRNEPELFRLLADQRILHHPFVTGELAMGNPSPRAPVFALLSNFPQAPVIDQQAWLDFVERTGTFGTGIGFVDAHLLASAEASTARLWTRDKRLAEQAARLGLLAAMA